MLNARRYVNVGLRYWIGSESHNVFQKKVPLFRDKDVLYVSPILSQVMSVNLETDDSKEKKNDYETNYNT